MQPLPSELADPPHTKVLSGKCFITWGTEHARVLTSIWLVSYPTPEFHSEDLLLMTTYNTIIYLGFHKNQILDQMQIAYLGGDPTKHG